MEIKPLSDQEIRETLSWLASDVSHVDLELLLDVLWRALLELQERRGW